MLDQLFLGQFLSLLCELLKNGAPLCLSLCSQARPQDLAEVKEEREGEITKEANTYEHPRVLFLAHITQITPLWEVFLLRLLHVKLRQQSHI